MEKAGIAVPEPVRLEAAYVSDPGTISARLRNVSPEATAVVALRPDGGLEEHQGSDVPVVITCGQSRIETNVHLDLTPCPAEPSPGGRAADLPEHAPMFVLDRRDQVLPAGPGIGWAGPGDLGARVSVSWSPDGLTVRLAVRDDVHSPPGEDANGFWNGDSVQIGIDPLNDAGDGGGYSVDDREFGISLSASRPRAYETVPTLRSVEFPVDAERDGDLALYRVLIPWPALGVECRPGLVLGANVIVSDNDGAGLGHRIGVATGIGEGKRPSVFPDLYLAG